MNSVAAFIRSLPRPVEFAIVISIAFGGAIYYAFEIPANPPLSLSISAEGLWLLVRDELLILFGLGWFLFVRGWDFGRTPLYPSVGEIVSGGALALLAVIGNSLYLSVALMFVTDNSPHVTAELDWPAIIAASLVNPIYEELFVCAYVVGVLRTSMGINGAILISAAIRMSYHVYQGPVAALFIGILGLVFAASFARTGKLWPVIMAHAGLDLTGLAQS